MFIKYIGDEEYLKTKLSRTLNNFCINPVVCKLVSILLLTHFMYETIIIIYGKDIYVFKIYFHCRAPPILP